jgi:hypothetical protein
VARTRYLVQIDDHANSFVAQEEDQLDSCVAVDLSQHRCLQILCGYKARRRARGSLSRRRRRIKGDRQKGLMTSCRKNGSAFKVSGGHQETMIDH